MENDVMNLKDRLFIHEYNILNYTGNDKEEFDASVHKECIVEENDSRYFELRNYMNSIGTTLIQCGSGYHPVIEVVLTIRGITTIITRVFKCLIHDTKIEFRFDNTESVTMVDIPEDSIINIHFQSPAYHGWVTEILIQESPDKSFPRLYDSSSGYDNQLFVQYNKHLAPLKLDEDYDNKDKLNSIIDSVRDHVKPDGISEGMFVANIDEFYKIKTIEKDAMVNDILYKREDGQRPLDFISRDPIHKIAVSQQFISDIQDIIYITETAMVIVIDGKLYKLYEFDILAKEMIRLCFSKDSLKNKDHDHIELFKGTMSITAVTIMKKLFDEDEYLCNKIMDKAVNVFFAVKGEITALHHMMYRYPTNIIHGIGYITIEE